MIFVSIASMADTELIPTVKDLLAKADLPHNIVVSIFLQDEESCFEDLQKIINSYSAELKFSYVPLEKSQGVVYARVAAKESLDPSIHKYFLQVDSHSRFIDSWDTKIVNDYENAIEKWGKFIFSVYPNGYDYENGKAVLELNDLPPSVMAISCKSVPSMYGAKPKKYEGDSFGELTGYFCGGFSFGYSAFFDNKFFNDQIYFNGEESYTSIWLHIHNIKVVAPPSSYVFHDYHGVSSNRRFSFFINQTLPKYQEYKTIFTDELISNNQIKSYAVLDDFFKRGIINNVYNEVILNHIASWEAQYVKAHT